MKIELTITDAVHAATALAVYAHKAIQAADEFPHSKGLVNAADRKFGLMNRYREAVGLPTLTVDELKEKFS